jgi:hypothetical protein
MGTLKKRPYEAEVIMQSFTKEGKFDVILEE